MLSRVGKKMHSHRRQAGTSKLFQVLGHCHHSGVGMGYTPNGTLRPKHALRAQNITGSEHKQAKSLTGEGLASARSSTELDDRRALANVMEQAPAKLLHRWTAQSLEHKVNPIGALGEIR